MLRSRFLAASFAWLSFTWASGAALAEARASEPDDDDTHVAALASVEFIGLGTRRFDGLFAAYGGEAHAFFTPNVGVGFRVSAYGAGAPDGNACDGVMVGAVVDGRLRVGARARKLWLWGGVGGGTISMQGYPYVSEPHFDDRGGVVFARAMLFEEWGVFAFGGGVEGFYVFGHGGAATPMLVGGIVF